jgi:hypothetical protein
MHKTYHVFDNGKPARYEHGSCWRENVFDTLAAAQDYAKRWVGDHHTIDNLQVNTPYDYSGYGDTIEIMEVFSEW